MSQRRFPRIVVLAVAGLALLWSAGSARAQQGWPINGSGWGYRGGSVSPPSWSQPAAEPAPATVAAPTFSNFGDYVPLTPPGEAIVGSPYYGPGQNVSSYHSFYNAGLIGDREALINVRVPARAQLWIGDEQVRTTSDTVRQFETPALEPGQVYSYTIRARWMENGQPVERTQKVKFRAGETANVNLFQKSGS